MCLYAFGWLQSKLNALLDTTNPQKTSAVAGTALHRAYTSLLHSEANRWDERRQSRSKFLSHTWLIAIQALEGCCKLRKSPPQQNKRRTAPPLLPQPQAEGAQLKGRSDLQKSPPQRQPCVLKEKAHKTKAPFCSKAKSLFALQSVTTHAWEDGSTEPRQDIPKLFKVHH